MYIRVPRENMLPADNGLTETVQHQVSQSTDPQHTAPVPHSVPMQPPATVSQQQRGDSSAIYSARVAVVQPGRCSDTTADSVESEPHVEGLTQHFAGCLAVPGASAAAEVKVLMNSGSSSTAMSEELVQAAADDANGETQAFVGHVRVVTSLSQQCDIDT